MLNSISWRKSGRPTNDALVPDQLGSGRDTDDKVARILAPKSGAFGRLIRERPLQAAQLRELGRCLARYEMPARYVLAGCCRHKDRIELNPGVGGLLEELASPQNTWWLNYEAELVD